MRAFLLFVFVAVCAGSVAELVSKFETFKADYGRIYQTVKEEEKAFSCFVGNLQEIERLNAIDTATHGINLFTDICPKDFKMMYHNLQVRPDNTTKTVELTPEQIKATESSYDWRSRGAVNKIQDQGQCGSCWAFSTVCTLEGAWFLAGKGLQKFSEAELVQCGNSGRTCQQGGDMAAGVNWVIQNGGIASESAYPYTSAIHSGRTGSCDTSVMKSSKVAKFSHMLRGPTSEASIATFSQTHGPVSIAVDAASGWQTYRGGIKTTCGVWQLDHGVNIVGWVTGSYWIVRNSWTSQWGEDGYIRLAYGKDCNGLNREVVAASV